MNNVPFLTVVILTYNRKDEVLITISNIVENINYPKDKYEIIVSDNNSSDGTCEEISRNFPFVKLIRLSKNLGLVGWNEGIRQGKGDFFLLLDDDSHPEYGIFEAIDYIKKNDNVGIVACNIFGGPFRISGIEDKSDCIGFINCGVIIRREVVEKVGFLRDWMFMFGNEWEYSIRVKNAGYGIVFLENCVVRHRASPKNRSYKFLRVYTTRNELATVWMYFNDFKKYLILFRVLFWNLLQFRGEGYKSIFYVLFGFYKFLKLMPNLEKYYIKKEVLLEYEKNFWSFKAILIY